MCIEKRENVGAGYVHLLLATAERSERREEEGGVASGEENTCDRKHPIHH
jgi:hypothetical protein